MHLDQCQQYLTAKMGGEEEVDRDVKAVKAQKKQRLENLLPKLYSKKAPFMKPRRIGVLEHSNSSADSQDVPATILQSSLPTMVQATENPVSPVESASTVSTATIEQPTAKLETRREFLAGDALVPSMAVRVPKSESVETDADALSMYAAQMQKEFESCLLSLNCEGDQA